MFILDFHLARTPHETTFRFFTIYWTLRPFCADFGAVYELLGHSTRPRIDKNSAGHDKFRVSYFCHAANHAVPLADTDVEQPVTK